MKVFGIRAKPGQRLMLDKDLYSSVFTNTIMDETKNSKGETNNEREREECSERGSSGES